jgi:hypothetical protein
MMLALKLGRTLAELSASMSSSEFSLWIALYREDHWGELRADERAGVIASTVANYAGMTRAQGAEPAKPRDFMLHLPPKTDEEEIEPDPVAFFSAVAEARK